MSEYIYGSNPVVDKFYHGLCTWLCGRLYYPSYFHRNPVNVYALFGEDVLDDIRDSTKSGRLTRRGTLQGAKVCVTESSRSIMIDIRSGDAHAWCITGRTWKRRAGAFGPGRFNIGPMKKSVSGNMEQISDWLSLCKLADHPWAGVQ